MIENLLNEILNILEKQGSPIRNYLNREMDENEIQEKTKDLPFSFSEDIVDIYQCFNGTKTQDDISIASLSFFPCGYLLSIDDAIASMKEIEILETEGKEKYGFPYRWNELFYPLFCDFAGGYWLAKFEKSRIHQCKIHYCAPDEPEFLLVYSSLEQLLQANLEMLVQGAVSYRDKRFIIDHEKFQAIDDRFCN